MEDQDPNCYPGSTVLMNDANLRDKDKLAVFENKTTAVNLTKLKTEPLRGEFNTKRLQATHARVFEGVYGWAGSFRDPSSGRVTKNRGAYLVDYEDAAKIDSSLNKVFSDLKADSGLKNLNQKEFAEKAAGYYSRLDEIHPFREGNSRTLRAFFSDLAQEAGHKLTWEHAAQSAETQQALYFARDVAVINRDNSVLVSAIDANIVAPTAEKAITRAFRELPAGEAVKAFPELAPAVAMSEALGKQFAADGLSVRQQQEALFRARENMSASIEQGKIPSLSVRQAPDSSRDLGDSGLDR